MKLRRASIRADGTRSIGIGHLRRCAVLADALSNDGYSVTFVRCGRADGLLPELASRFTTLWVGEAPADALLDQPSGERGDAEESAALIGKAGRAPSWVVVDHYGLHESWEARLRADGHLVLALDDFRHRRHCADLLVSDSPAPFRPGSNAVAAAIELCGFEYALLGPEFQYHASERAADAHGLHIFVTLGGSDPTGDTIRVCEALSAVSARLTAAFARIDVVAGPGYGSLEPLRKVANRVPNFRLHHAPPSLAPLLRSADLVITAAGNTLAEAIALRKPCVVIVTADNQRTMARELGARGLVEIAGESQDLAVTDLAASLERVIRDWPALHERVVRGGAVFDHLGADRIVAAMHTVEATRAAQGNDAG